MNKLTTEQKRRFPSRYKCNHHHNQRWQENGIPLQTKVTFVPKSNRIKGKNSFATEIQLVLDPNDKNRSDNSLPPPCPHC